MKLKANSDERKRGVRRWFAEKKNKSNVLGRFFFGGLSVVLPPDFSVERVVFESYW